jgi:hypothetical protein
MAVTPAARQAWPRWWLGVAAWALWALTMLGLPSVAWLDHLLRQAGFSKLTIPQAAGVPLAVAAVSSATVGALLASRRPTHPVGWLLLAIGLLVPLSGVANDYRWYGMVARPGALPAASYLAGISNGIVPFLPACIGFVLLLTPTGSLPSPRWRWWARIAAAAPVVFLVSSALDPQPLYPEYPTVGNPLAVPAALTSPLRGLGQAGGVVIVAALVVAAGSLVVRFRRAHGVERQQLRWMAIGAALAALAIVVAVAAALVSKEGVVAAGLGTCVALLPVATGAAILRYRLYDLDRIISRTLAYGLLTLLLGGAYVGVVLGLGQLLGRDSSLVVAGATLAVAAVFQPARRRVQRSVDRRFNRRRYDAARTIAAFSARLRQQVDLDTLTAELLGVVEQTVQPTSASLWLRPSVSASAEQRSMGASRAASPPAAASPSAATGL